MSRTGDRPARAGDGAPAGNTSAGDAMGSSAVAGASVGAATAGDAGTPVRRRVLVTGAARGLGLALAKELLRTGHFVYAAARDPRSLDRELGNAGRDFLTLRLDVTDEVSIASAAAALERHTDTLDAVINNAGLLIRATLENSIEELDLSNLRATFEVNAFGPLAVVKHTLRFLRNADHPLILNVSSDSGSLSRFGRPNWYDYAMSKAALNMASKILQSDSPRHRAKVLAVHPGWVQTDMGGPGARLTPEESARKLTALVDRSWHDDDPIFVDNEGRVFDW